MARVDLSFKIRGSEGQQPAPPSSIVVDNINKTLTWTNSTGYSDSQHEYSFNYSTTRTWLPVNEKPIQIGNVNINAEDIAVRVKGIGINLPSEAIIASQGFTQDIEIGPGENYFELTDAEELAAYVYYALSAKNTGGSQAQNDQSVNEIPAIKGDVPLVYDGIPSPTLTKRPPIFNNYGLGSVSFDNEPLVKFTGPISRINTPVEVSLTLIRQPGTPHEAWYNYGGIYAGDTGEGIRLAHSDKFVEGSQAPPFYHISNIHVKFTASRADLWIDGGYQGFVDYPERNEPTKLDSVEIGVHTNNSQWEFIAYHLFPRSLTDQERNSFFAQASAKFHWGQEKHLPYAKDIYVTRSGDTLTAHYTYTNPLGFPEDKSKTIYRWVGLGDGWLSNQITRDGYGGTCTMAIWPPDTTQVKVEVQVFDTQGNTWKRLAGIWFFDIDGTQGTDPEPEPGTEETRLTFDPEDVFASNLNTQFDEGEKFIHQRSLDKLADQSYIVDVNNAPTGLPVDGPVVHVNGYGSYSPSWYNMGGFFEFTIDLRSVCEITKIFMVLNSHSSSPLRVWGSLDGINKTLLLDSPNMPIGNGAWYPLPVDISEATNVRYLSFGVAHGELGLNGIAIYGIRKTPKVGLGFKSTRSVPLRKFTDTLGTNAFLEENDYDMIANTSTFVRYYNDSGWLVSSFAGTTLSPDQIVLFPKTSHMWDFDAKMQSAIAHGHKILFCYKNSPDHLGQLVGRENSEAKPTDPGLNARDWSVTTDPMSYTHMARIAFLFAARYGKNSNIDPVYDSQYSDPNPPYGLNLFEYFELGNEPDGHWKGQDAVTMPQELAAMYSAVYDGHKGALGAGFGIKAADPAMKFANGGFAGFRPGWFKEMCLWWDANRGPGDYPIQVMNIHCYNAYEEEYNTPMYSPIPAYGVPPEQGTYLPEMKKLSNFRDKVMPTAELWVTETGYDEQYGGMYAPNDRNQTPRSRHKAAWILRTFLVINKYSDVITQYWYGDDWYRLSDYNPDNIQRETFVTTGYVEGITQAKDRNRRPMTTYWYIVSFKADMKDYYFSHIVVEAGVQRTTQDIGITMHPELWVMAFRKIDGSSCLVAWLGCSDWKTHAAQIDVPETTVQVTDYVEHEVRQSLVGNVTSVPASNGKISLTITEYPLIIKTANIGVGKLETPVNLKIVNGVLSWDDFNAVGTVTEIYSSSLPDSGFTLIHSSVLSQGKYTLPLSNDQHYRVRLINDVSFSDFSETVSKQ